jgi:hypothetical protein
VALFRKQQAVGSNPTAGSHKNPEIKRLSRATVKSRFRLAEGAHVKCAPAAQLLEFEYLDVLRLLQTYRLEDGHLVLASLAGRPQLTFSAR